MAAQREPITVSYFVLFKVHLLVEMGEGSRTIILVNNRIGL